MPSRKPSRPCTICTHPDRALIEAACVAGVSVTALADKHSVSRDSLYRHMRNHVTEEQRASYIADAPIRELAAKAAEQGSSLIDYYVLARAALYRNFQMANAHGDIAAANNTVRTLFECLRDMGKLNGEMLNAAPVTNITTNNYAVITQSAAFTELQAMLVQRLAPFPEALAAVLAGLDELDAKAGNPPASGDAARLIDLKPVNPAPTEGDHGR
jgi:hypothetical protein